MAVTCEFDPEDNEIPAIERILLDLNAHRHTMSYEQLERNAVEAFGEIDIEAVVLWEVGGLEAIPTEMVEATLKLMLRPGIPIPEITLVRRLKPREYDHERQRWDVQHDTLGIDQPGAIGPNGLITPPKSVGFIDKKG